MVRLLSLSIDLAAEFFFFYRLLLLLRVDILVYQADPKPDVFSFAVRAELAT